MNNTSLSCGFLDVPLDYHDPSVGNARLAIIKANATGERRGSVFFNPGELIHIYANAVNMLTWRGSQVDPEGRDSRQSTRTRTCYSRSPAAYTTSSAGIHVALAIAPCRACLLPPYVVAN